MRVFPVISLTPSRYIEVITLYVDNFIMPSSMFFFLRRNALITVEIYLLGTAVKQVKFVCFALKCLENIY